MQRRRSCQNSCSIHVYIVPTAVCTPVLYTLILTVQLSFLSDRLEHRIHPGDAGHHTDTTQSQMLSLGSPSKKWNNHLKAWQTKQSWSCSGPYEVHCTVHNWKVFLNSTKIISFLHYLCRNFVNIVIKGILLFSSYSWHSNVWLQCR